MLFVWMHMNVYIFYCWYFALLILFYPVCVYRVRFAFLFNCAIFFLFLLFVSCLFSCSLVMIYLVCCLVSYFKTIKNTDYKKTKTNQSWFHEVISWNDVGWFLCSCQENNTSTWSYWIRTFEWYWGTESCSTPYRYRDQWHHHSPGISPDRSFKSRSER